MNSLIPLTNRPSVVYQGTCAILISVHDDYYMRTLKALKQLIRDTHPDRRRMTKVGTMPSYDHGKCNPRFRSLHHVRSPNSTVPFLAAKKKLDQFIEEEIKWYGQFDLRPPDGHEDEKIPPPTSQPLQLTGASST